MGAGNRNNVFLYTKNYKKTSLCGFLASVVSKMKTQLRARNTIIHCLVWSIVHLIGGNYENGELRE
jgi:glutaredoxin-related protein